MPVGSNDAEDRHGGGQQGQHDRGDDGHDQNMGIGFLGGNAANLRLHHEGGAVGQGVKAHCRHADNLIQRLRIHAESEEGQWCRFVFTLPAAKA